MSSADLWQIAVAAPLPQLLTYSSDMPLQPGQTVRVPLGKRSAQGVVIARETSPRENLQIKSISESLETFPILSPQHVEWALWIAKYYHYPAGEVFSFFFPPLPQKSAKAKTKDFFTEDVQEKQIELNKEQAEIVSKIETLDGFSSHLLWGITGSGKTEVYIELIKKKLAKNQSAMILVPEIALTPQLVSRFRSRLGDQVAVLHSGLTDRERTNQWWDLIEKKKRVLIGARSALFCPLPDLGLIVVDEEHESSYKQDEKLRYNARDSAIVRAQLEKIPVILGSATPSLETWKNVLDKKYHLHRLTQRASKLLLPPIEVVDLGEIKNEERRESFLPFWLSTSLYQALSENYKQGFQSALFLNRRGIAQTVLCNDCGFIYKCPNCEISLTLHGQSHLVCHYCDYSQQMSTNCPDCRLGEIKALGLGTEQIQQDMQRLFPHSQVFRVDRDEIDSRKRMEDFISKMESGEIHFLVGTQMIAKGLDFEKLTLVGIVLADVGFHLPDFRASERSYQLLTQVSGRSGRHHQGRVIVQTYKPDHPSIVFAQKEDAEGFFDSSLKEREALSYPPYTKLACLKISGLDEKQVQQQVSQLTSSLKNFITQKNLDVKILGPAPAPLYRLRNRYRHQILAKSSSLAALHKVLQCSTHLQSSFKQLKIQIDMDPYNLM